MAGIVPLSDKRLEELLKGGMLADGCDVNLRKSDGVTIIDYDGALDGHTYLIFQEFLSALIQSGHRKIVLNCAKLTYLGSAGIHVVSSAVRLFRELEGDFRLCATTEGVGEVVEMVGLEFLVNTFPKEAEAVASYASV